MSDYTLLCGDALTMLRTLPSDSVHMVCTSPPYYGLRSYLPNGHPDKAQELGGEETPEQYVARLVDVFREVRRVLHPSGVAFINIGDSYAASSKGTGGKSNSTLNAKRDENGDLADDRKSQPWMDKPLHFDLDAAGLKPKDLIGIPWLLAFALRADGWWLRQEIIWHKLAPMPESVTDRCTKAHEQVFLLAKSERYFFDAEAIKENTESPVDRRLRSTTFKKVQQIGHAISSAEYVETNGRNKRSVWTLGPESYSGSHYAVMPSKLVEPCVLAGSSAYGACAKCLAPYERVVEREGIEAERTTPSKVARAAGNGNVDRNIPGGYSPTVTTLGWQPTCLCAADIVPAVVLDPFFGSGTVLAVALKYGRRAIGIDLDSRNLELARKRIEGTQPMLLDITA